MKENKIFLLRRIIETTVIGLTASVSVFILVLINVIPSTNSGYISGFSFSALIFFILYFRTLYAHFWAVNFSVVKYLAVNLSIWAASVGVNLIAIQKLPDMAYTALFGYTKPFRKMFEMSTVEAAMTFWGICLIFIFIVIMAVLCFDRNYKMICKTKSILEDRT